MKKKNRIYQIWAIGYDDQWNVTDYDAFLEEGALEQLEAIFERYVENPEKAVACANSLLHFYPEVKYLNLALEEVVEVDGAEEVDDILRECNIDIETKEVI